MRLGIRILFPSFIGGSGFSVSREIAARGNHSSLVNSCVGGMETDTAFVPARTQIW